MRKKILFRISFLGLTLLMMSIAFGQSNADTLVKKVNSDTIPPVTARDTIPPVKADTLPKVDSPYIIVPVVEPLRIINLNPYLTLNVDSVFEYDLKINKNESDYHWFITRSAVNGVKLDSKTGKLQIRPVKSYFLSNRLQYDTEYKIGIGVQSLKDPSIRVDTVMKILFYNTEIIPSKLKLSTTAVITINEGEPLNIGVQCENGTFPIENVTFYSSVALVDVQGINQCGQNLSWTPTYEFVKETDSAKLKIFNLYFVGTTKMLQRDTASVRVIVKNALDYPSAVKEHAKITADVNRYILQLKYTFFQLDGSVKKTKRTRTSFDITSSATSLSGTIFSSSTKKSNQNVGKVLPGVGVTLVPVKEAAAPQKNTEQNQATLIRSSIKRLELMVQENRLIGNQDELVLTKTNKLKDELKQMQLQLIDVPLELASSLSEEDLNAYFNSPKVNRKYRTKKRR
jgi:hypothetical protein